MSYYWDYGWNNPYWGYNWYTPSWSLSYHNYGWGFGFSYGNPWYWGHNWHTPYWAYNWYQPHLHYYSGYHDYYGLNYWGLNNSIAYYTNNHVSYGHRDSNNSNTISKPNNIEREHHNINRLQDLNTNQSTPINNKKHNNISNPKPNNSISNLKPNNNISNPIANLRKDSGDDLTNPRCPRTTPIVRGNKKRVLRTSNSFERSFWLPEIIVA